MTENEKDSNICIACGSSRSTFFFTKNSFDFYSCAECDMVSIKNIPENVEKVYSDDYFSGARDGFGFVDYDVDKEPMRGSFVRYMEDLEKFAPKKGTLLDIGAATGFFMDIAEKRGWKTSGVEISKYATDIGVKKGLDVRVGTLSTVPFPKNSFDAVTMCDVIEHFTDPDVDVRLAHDVLKQGGVLLVNTTDSGSLYAKLLGKHWHLYVPPEHIHCFSAKALKIFLEKRGFEVVLQKCPSKKFTLEYVSHTLANWLNLKPLHWLTSFLAKNWIGKIMIPINLHDNAFVIAKKL